MRYPARLTPEFEDAFGGYVVTFRDMPEAISQGDDLDDAREEGQDALITCLDFYYERRQPVPLPSEQRVGEWSIEVPTYHVMKIRLWNFYCMLRGWK